MNSSRLTLPLVVLFALAQGTCLKRFADADEYAPQRSAMVRRQIAGRGVTDKRVLQAMGKVKRHQFVPPPLRAQAYDDNPLPIGEGQTISQPYIVGYMTEALRLKSSDRVLEIGTGSGYQAAVLAEIAREVHSIEIIPALGQRSRALLRRLGYSNITVRIGDGYGGWPSRAPFDAIILTASPPRIPQPLIDQLKLGGRLVAPEGRLSESQQLIRLTKTKTGIKRERLLGVRFVPMTGKAQR